MNSKYEYMARKNKELEDEVNQSMKDKLTMFDQKEIRKMENSAKEEAKLLETKNIELLTQLEVLKNQLSNERSLLGEQERKITQNETDLTKLRN